eukprot:9714646-Heterocapsa_arctica.AAC.1
MQEIAETFSEEQPARADSNRCEPGKSETRSPAGKPAGPQQPPPSRRAGPWRVLEIFAWAC